MLRQHAKTIHYLHRIIDISIHILSFITAFLLWNKFITNGLFQVNFTHLALLLALIVPINILVFSANNLYNSQRFLSITEQTKSLTKAYFICSMLIMAAISILKLDLPGRKFMLLFFALDFSLLILKRITASFLIIYLRKKNMNARDVLIVGTEKEATQIITAINDNPGWGVRIQGIIAMKKAGTWANHCTIKIKGHTVIGSIEDFDKIIDNNVYDLVLFAISPWELEAIQPYLMTCMQIGLEAKVSANFFKKLPFVNTNMDFMFNMPIISFSTIDHNPLSIFVKRLIDLSTSIAGLIILSPLFALLAMIIKLDSPGPVFFSQKRVGKNGRFFNMYKFRSMRKDAEAIKAKLSHLNEMSGPVFKITDDPRITRIGKFIRKASIDELPQLLNVLKGDMSLVGPRPPLPSEVKDYATWQKRRLSVKPGITCTWQVSGRNNIDFETWMKMDLDYIDTWSLQQDIKLLVKTMPAILMQKGAK